MHNAAKRNMIAQRRWFRYRALKFPGKVLSTRVLPRFNERAPYP
jgi:hypothetical protein